MGLMMRWSPKAFTLAFTVALLAGLSLAAGAAEPAAPGARMFDIEPKPLNLALTEFAQQAGLQVVFVAEIGRNLASGGLAGSFTPQEALTRLLANTPFDYDFINPRTVTIRAREQGGKSTAASKPFPRLAQVEAPPVAENSVAPGAGAANGAATDSSSGNAVGGLQEIVVTANRRLQRAQDVAGSLQVFGGSDLERNGANGFADYLTTVPGLSFRDQGNGANKITLRGVSNIGGYDGGNGTVATTGLYLNDVPVQGTSTAADVALYDIQRIEVLKGPQGTLYGEGAMGGAIKMILNPPDLTEYAGKADLSLASTESGGFDYQARGAVNLPLMPERLAVRLVGTYLSETGFVDNVTRGDENHDDREVHSVRALVGASLTDRLSAELLAYRNVIEQDDFPQIEPNLGDLRIASAEDRFSNTESTLLGLTLKYDFGGAELTSVTSNYTFERDFADRIVFGSAYFGAYGPITQEPYRIKSDLKHSLAQELRLVSQGDQRFDWVVGAFYRDKEQDTPAYGSVAPDELAAVNAGLAAASEPQLGTDGIYFSSLTVQTYEQYAVYGEGSLELGGGVELTAGLRWFTEDSSSTTSTVGRSVLSWGTSPAVTVPLKDSGAIPKVALSWEVAPDHRIYTQVAKGFRSGSPNLNLAFGGDEGAESDTLWSYELGSKNSLAGGRAILNASAFFLDWKDIQTIAFVPAVFGGSIGVIENAGDAEIYGFETELAANLTNGFSLGASAGYTHTKLTHSLGNGLVGSKLPSTPEWTASGYGEYRLQLPFGEVFARLEIQYVDEQNTALVQVDGAGNITNSGLPLDAYTNGNLRIGLERDDGWGVRFFVQNLWDERAELGRGLEQLLGTDQPDRFSISRPRSFGVAVSKVF